MEDDQQHVWVVKNPEGQIEVPVLHDEVARTFEEVGWHVERLPVADLKDRDLNCLQKACWVRR